MPPNLMARASSGSGSLASSRAFTSLLTSAVPFDVEMIGDPADARF
jgi:hypothetical protein